MKKGIKLIFLLTIIVFIGCDSNVEKSLEEEVIEGVIDELLEHHYEKGYLAIKDTLMMYEGQLLIKKDDVIWYSEKYDDKRKKLLISLSKVFKRDYNNKYYNIYKEKDILPHVSEKASSRFKPQLAQG